MSVGDDKLRLASREIDRDPGRHVGAFVAGLSEASRAALFVALQGDRCNGNERSHHPHRLRFESSSRLDDRAASHAWCCLCMRVVRVPDGTTFTEGTDCAAFKAKAIPIVAAWQRTESDQQSAAALARAGLNPCMRRRGHVGACQFHNVIPANDRCGAGVAPPRPCRLVHGHGGLCNPDATDVRTVETIGGARRGLCGGWNDQPELDERAEEVAIVNAALQADLARMQEAEQDRLTRAAAQAQDHAAAGGLDRLRRLRGTP